VNKKLSASLSIVAQEKDIAVNNILLKLVLINTVVQQNKYFISQKQACFVTNLMDRLKNRCLFKAGNETSLKLLMISNSDVFISLL
jgi:hypothetical protein